MVFGLATDSFAEPLTYTGFKGSPVDLMQEVAVHAGLFAKRGLDVNFVAAASGQQALSALIGGTSDISVVNMAQSAAVLKQGQCLQHLTNGIRVFYNIVAQPDLDLPHANEPFPKNLADLEGKRIGILHRGSSQEKLMDVVFKSAGLDMSKLNYVATGAGATAVAAFRARQVDIGITFPFQEQILKPEEFKYIQKLMDVEEGNPIYNLVQTFSATSCDFAKANPEKINSYCEAMVDTYKYAKDPANKANIVKIISETQKIDPVIAGSFWDQYYNLYPAPELTEEIWQSQKLVLPDGEDMPDYHQYVSKDCLAITSQVKD